jgi:hypothetical protein
MMRPQRKATALLLALALAALAPGCGLQTGERKPRTTLFIGVDTSGSFQRSGYDDAMSFLAHYIYGHLNNLGGLETPRELFVAPIGGEDEGEPKSFRPVHDFAGKDIPAIEAALREWFAPNDALTDFNPFFKEVARITKERNLVLTPITVMIATDGVPDLTAAGTKAGSKALYEQIDLGALEYLSRRVTLRLAYVSPKVGENWREHVPRQRVRLWTVDADVMSGWRDQVDPQQGSEQLGQLWEWIQHNVDYRVRSIGA